MNKKDLIASIIFLAIAVVIYSYASTFPVKDGATIAMSAGFYPRFISIILAILSVLMMAESVKKKTTPDDCPVPDTTPLFRSKGGFNLMLTIALLVAYPFLLEKLGFATAAFAFILTMIIVLTQDFRKKIGFIIILSVVLTAVMYLIFKIFLQIPFPRGILI
jgi:hypothetical protein